MKPWFIKRTKHRPMRGAPSLFDDGNDRDPWASEEVSFFRRNNQPPEQPQEPDENSGVPPISFPKLEASYESMRAVRRQQETPSSPSEQPLHPASLRNPPHFIDLAENGPALPKNPPQPPTYNPIEPTERLFDRGGLRHEQPAPAPTKEPPSLEPTVAPSPEPHVEPPVQELPADPALPQSPQSEPPASSARPAPEHDQPSIFQVSIIALGICILIALLWLIHSQNHYKPTGEDGQLLVINPPAIIKERPSAKEKPVVPYQDDLVYGKIDGEEFDAASGEEGERLLPQTEFPPDLPEENSEIEEVSPEQDLTPYLQPPPLKEMPVTNIVTMDEAVLPRAVRRPAARPLPAQTPEPAVAPPPIRKKPRPAAPPVARKAPTRAATKQTAPATQRKYFFIKLGVLPSEDRVAAEASRLRGRYSILRGCGLVVRGLGSPAHPHAHVLLAGPFLSEKDAKVVSEALGGNYHIIE